MANVYSGGEAERAQRMQSRALFGTPDVVAGKLRALATTFDVEEIAVLTTLHDKQARRHSYALLAREMMP